MCRIRTTANGRGFAAKPNIRRELIKAVEGIFPGNGRPKIGKANQDAACNGIRQLRNRGVGHDSERRVSPQSDVPSTSIPSEALTSPNGNQGVGLSSMRERSALLGGTFDFETNRRGCLIVVSVPLKIRERLLSALTTQFAKPDGRPAMSATGQAGSRRQTPDTAAGVTSPLGFEDD